MIEVFKFLDNETSVGEDLKLISSLPKSNSWLLLFHIFLNDIFKKKSSKLFGPEDFSFERN